MTDIKCCNLTKFYGKHKVLKNVNFESYAGSITGIIGRNGSGKTVLFKAISGLISLDEGEIIVNESKKRNGEILKSVGIIIEEPAFLSNCSGIKNLEYLYMINNKRNKDYLCNIMNKVGLNPYEKKHVAKYSLGMRQRLAIAQAIMENPDCLILDEPFNGLDNQGVKEMRSLFLNLKYQGKNILVASHNPDDIRILCDNVYEMDNGVLTKIS